jgi:hypothetical protein
VVAGRSRKQAAAPFLLGQICRQVETTPYLKSADRVVILMLDPDLCPDQSAETGVIDQRRRPEMAVDVGRAAKMSWRVGIG